jgi:hypothetical protein
MHDLLGSKAILAPVIALAAWTLVMLTWMIAVRVPALGRAGIKLKGAVGGRPGVLDGVVDDKAQWKAHNYLHLVEQPTLFYAVAISLALLGHGSGFALLMAWLYVALRVVHSLVQATVNIIAIRLPIFLLSSLCLLAMTVEGLIVVARAY